ncbi:MAG: extracellular solute-binding protein [Ruminococcaceae bacterium]|nr:extracellular solute-binding protein [Oscillospiraceae bacterium]
MKNTLKKTLAILLAITMLAVLSACGSKNSGKSANSTTDIEISYWNAGLGSKWLEDMVEAFNKKNTKYRATFHASANHNSAAATYGMDGDTVDLYLLLMRGDKSKMEPLDDVLNTTLKGENKSIMEKFNSGYLSMVKAADGHYYELSYGGGVIGIVYNKEHFKKAGITQLPRTTNELAITCDKLNSKGYKPFCHFAAGGYWPFFSELFFSQYDGNDYYVNNFYACKDTSGTSPSKDVFTAKDGRYQVLKTYEKIITPEYIMPGSNSIDHTSAQTQFLNGSASMMVSGSWLTNEMSGSKDKINNFAMMRSPVISAITDKCTAIKGEGLLRKVISAIDSIADGEKKAEDFKNGNDYLVDGETIPAADWELVWNARFSVPTNFSGHCASIPTYSNCKDGAKEFLKFFYSDEGYKIYTNAVRAPLPYFLSTGAQADMDGFNDFEKSQFRMLAEAVHTPTEYIATKHRVFTDGGASSFCGIDYISALCASNKDDCKTANQLWDMIEQKVNDNYDTWISDIK